jgi:catechol 2,3-dioxygenase-like lactoylglutathione lyase family enzyme
MLTGAHVVLYSTDAEADRAFFRDVLGFPYVDAGAGWLIFGLPPAEVAVHPADGEPAHELYLMCDDLDAMRNKLAAIDVQLSDVTEAGWGRLTRIALPGGGEVGLYEPHHPSPVLTAAPDGPQSTA